MDEVEQKKEEKAEEDILLKLTMPGKSKEEYVDILRKSENVKVEQSDPELDLQRISMGKNENFKAAEPDKELTPVNIPVHLSSTADLKKVQQIAQNFYSSDIVVNKLKKK